MEKNKKNNKKKINISTIVLICVFIAGISLMLYPLISNYWNSVKISRVLSDYNEAVADMTEEDFSGYWDSAHEYNRELTGVSNRFSMNDNDEAKYESLLNVAGDGVMGHIQIPSIRVDLPIYHTVDEDVLQHSAGHLPGSSLPVGGESTHCVISAHRGLPAAKLFTNLDRLVEGDIFIINVLDDVLVYEVDQIKTVLPDKVYDLEIEQGEDYCTLVTCTPYGINTHRLLVRGHRIENTVDTVVTESDYGIEPMIVITIAAVPILLIVLTAMLCMRRKKRGTEKNDDAGTHRQI